MRPNNIYKTSSVVPVNKWSTILQSEPASAHTTHFLKILPSSTALDKVPPIAITCFEAVTCLCFTYIFWTPWKHFHRIYFVNTIFSVNYIVFFINIKTFFRLKTCLWINLKENPIFLLLYLYKLLKSWFPGIVLNKPINFKVMHTNQRLV